MTTVKGGLIQMSLKGDTSMSPQEIRDKMIDAHVPLIEQAAQAGRQVLCLQEVFTQPYFCPSQDAKWYARRREDSRRPDHQADAGARQEVRAWSSSCRSTRRTMTGVYYNTAAVIDADGKYLGKYRKTHIPQVAGFYEKFFFKPGNLGYPVFETAYCKLGVYICYDRHFPEGWRALALNGAEYIVNPSATVAGPQPVSLGAGAARRGRRQRLSTSARSTASAPKRRGTSGEFYGSSYFVNPRGKILRQGQRGQGRARRRRHGLGHGARGARPLAVLPRPPAGDLRAADGDLRIRR